MTSSADMNAPTSLQLLGIGSANDRALKRNLVDALSQMALDIPIEEVRDIDSLLEYGISGIPALLVNGQVVFQKVVPSVEDIRIVLNVLLQKNPPAANPIQRIVVPTDFSDAADHAFRYACEMAALLQADIQLVHVHQPVVDMGGVTLVKRDPELIHDKMDRLEEMLANRTQLSRSARKVRVAAEVKVGFVVEELQRLSAERADMIVMGMTGGSNLIDKWLGTTATEMSRKSNCPVLLIPEHATFRIPHDIVYASAYLPGEEKLLPRILSFVNQFDATLHFVHIEAVKNTSSYSVQQIPVSLPHLDHEVRMQFSTVNSRDVLTGLHRYSADHQSDILVMGSPRRNPVKELFHRSTTRKMILQAASPLLIMHFDKD